MTEKLEENGAEVDLLVRSLIFFSCLFENLTTIRTTFSHCLQITRETKHGDPIVIEKQGILFANIIIM